MKKAPKAKSVGKAAASPAKEIDAKIKALGDWRGATLARVRAIIRAADPQVIETVKWGGVPVWERDGIICTGETYKDKVKLTFAKGAALADPARRSTQASTAMSAAPSILALRTRSTRRR